MQKKLIISNILDNLLSLHDLYIVNARILDAIKRLLRWTAQVKSQPIYYSF